MPNDDYEKGRNDMLSELCSSLNHSLGLKLPSDRCSNFVQKLACILVERPCLLKFHRIDCKLSELFTLCSDLIRLITRAQQNLSSEGRLKISGLKIDIKVKHEQFANTEKEYLASQFVTPDLSSEEYLEIIDNLSSQIIDAKKTASLPRDFDDFAQIFEEALRKNSEDSKVNSNFCSQNILPVVDTSIIKYQRQARKIVNEKEWEKQEIAYLKGKYQIKKSKLEQKKNELAELDKEIKRKNLEIEKEKAELEKLKSSYNKERARLGAATEKKASKISQVIGSITSMMESQENLGRVSPITETENYSDTSSIIHDSDMEQQDSDLKILQQRLLECEQQSKLDSSDYLLREMGTLRNHIVKLRSKNAIRLSVSQRKKCEGIRNFHHSLTESNKNHSVKQLPPMTINSLISPRSRAAHSGLDFPVKLHSATPKAFAGTPKSLSTCFSFNEIYHREADEEGALLKYLRAKELKLLEKETELEKEKEHLMNNWKKLPMANELIPMVQREILDLREAKDRHRKYFEALERKEIELCTKMEEAKLFETKFKDKEREINAQKEKFELEKAEIIEKLERLKQEIL